MEKQFIYADNAATTKMSDIAVQAMLPYLQEIYANASSVHLLGQRSAAALFSARQQAAQVLNCAPKEVFFTSGGSEADNQALISAAALGKKQGKCHIVSTAMEHHAVLHTLEALEQEARTTPKPGLVDARNCGSHPDMSLPLLLRSAHALAGYFAQCAALGFDCAEEELFPALQAAGVHAEADMLAATSGVNTHKGAVFSLDALTQEERQIIADGCLINHYKNHREEETC